ncbi:MAG: hypothetical protein MZW92_05595 [Comamonadaceae bacterium]|nr:hypothetical protein [Comamonadaceae bacterium]
MAKEWKAAIDQDKDLLPLLLDATPLPPELGEFNGSIFAGRSAPATSCWARRARRPSSHGRVGASGAGGIRKSARWLPLGGLAAVVAVAVAVGLFLAGAPHPPETSVVPGTTPIPAPVPVASSALRDPGAVLLVGGCCSASWHGWRGA